MQHMTRAMMIYMYCTCMILSHVFFHALIWMMCRTFRFNNETLLGHWTDLYIIRLPSGKLT